MKKEMEDNNDNMKETKESKRVLTSTIILSLTLLSMALVGLFMYEEYTLIKTKYIESGQVITRLENEKKYLKLALEASNFTVSKLQTEYSEYKKTVNEIVEAEKNQAQATLKRDIIKYIREHYVKVSSVVAGAIAETVIELSEKYEVPVELVLGIIEEESWFTPRAESKAGAIGLMQIMPEWVPKLKLKSKRDLYEIDINIDAGIRVLKIHIDEENGSIKEGLFKYVNKDKAYVNKVLAAAGRFTIFRQTKIKDSLSKKSSNMKVKVASKK